LAFDSAGNLFVADFGAPGISPSIYKFTSDGTRTVFAGPNAFTDGTGPAGLAFDASGNLFVSTKAIRETTLFSSSLPPAWRALSLPV
jgi:hypothetical protein